MSPRELLIAISGYRAENIVTWSSEDVLAHLLLVLKLTVAQQQMERRMPYTTAARRRFLWAGNN